MFMCLFYMFLNVVYLGSRGVGAMYVAKYILRCGCCVLTSF